ncbi:MAG: DUF6067 family protein [Flavobacteriaceae bacterium]
MGKSSPITVDRDDVKATIYVKNGRALISIASWAPEKVNVKLDIDVKALGMDGKKVTLYAPQIKEFQEESTFELSDGIPMLPAKGWLLYLK